jgi:uncharacterized protein (UPF0254 family)
MPKNPNRPSFVTIKLARAYQPYVDQQIRRMMHKGVTQEQAIDRALDLRDARIKKGLPPPKYGRK